MQAETHLERFVEVAFGPGVLSNSTTRVILGYLPAFTATRLRDYREEVFNYHVEKLEAVERAPSRPWIRPAYQRAAKKIGPVHVRW